METYSSGLQVTAFHGNLLRSQWLVLQVRGLMHPLFLFCSQRTYSHPASLTLTWALSSKWWSALEQPPCSVLPAATLTQKLPGSRISCRSTRLITTGESSSSAQVINAFFPFFPPQSSLLFVPEGFSPSHFALISLSVSTRSFPPPTYVFIFSSNKAAVFLALVHPFSYCCCALLLPWLLAVSLSCPSLLLLLYELTLCAVANSSRP